MMQKEETAMKYSRAWAIARQQAEGELPVLAFFGHTAYPDRITETCLSQWYPCRFEEDGVVYNCAEQYMMAHKALTFGDRETLAQIMAAEDPKTCKALGRRVKPFDSAVWNREKYAVVVNGNLAKFGQNPELRAFLTGTGDAVLVEASPWDNVWGIRLGEKDPRVKNPAEWQGQNLLGFALMEVRDRLRAEG